MRLRRPRLLDALLLLGISLAWAAGYLFIGATARGAPPLTATALMTAIGAAVVMPFVVASRRPVLEPLRRRPRVVLLMGLGAVAVPNLAEVVAERSITAELAAVLGTSVPVFTLLWTTLVTRETPPSARRLAGALVAVGGLVVFTGGTDLLADAGRLEHALVMLAGGLVFALNGLLVDRQTGDLDPLPLVAWTLVFGTVSLAAAAWWLERPAAAVWTPGILGAILAEGVLGMGLAYLVYYALVARAGATFASLYAFLVPPLGVLGAAAVLDEPLTAGHLLGLGIVLAGLVLVGHGRADRRRTLGAPDPPRFGV